MSERQGRGELSTRKTRAESDRNARHSKRLEALKDRKVNFAPFVQPTKDFRGELSNDADSFESARYYGERVRDEGSAVFLNWIADIDKLRTRDEIEAFLEKNRRIFESFRVSPSPIAHLDSRGMLDTALAMSKIPEFQANVDASVSGEIVLRFAFGESIDAIETWLSEGDVARKIDKILYTVSLARHAYGQGSWATGLFYKLKQLIEQTSKEETHPLVVLAFDQAQRAIGNEIGEPSVGAVRISGAPNRRHLPVSPERALRQSETLNRRIRSTADSYLESELQIVARDCLVSVDSTGLPQSFSTIEKQALQSNREEQPEVVEAVEWKEAIEREGFKFWPRQAMSFFLFAREVLGDDPKQLAEYFEGWSPEECGKFFESMDRLQEVRKRLSEQSAFFMEEAMKKNEQKTEETRRTIVNFVKRDPRYKGKLETILPQLESTDLEHAFDMMTNIAYQTPELRGLIGEMDTYHQLSFQEAQERDEAFKDSLLTEEIIQGLEVEERTIKYAQTKEFKEGAKDFVDFIAKEDTRPRLRFERFAPFVTDMQRAGLGQDREAFEITREYMRPELRSALEENLDVDLTELSLREQIELFKYLNTSTAEEAEEVFANAREYGVTYLQTFLVAERQPEAVKTIQEIAGGDKEKARQIFERFGEIVKDAQDNVTNILREKLQNPDSATIEMEQELRNELLSRAGMFFESAAKASKSGSSSSIDAVLSRYEKETVLFASFFKTLHAEIGNDALYNVRGLSLGIERGARVTRDEREEMEKIMRLNWIKEGKEVVDQVVSEFNASLTGERGDRSYLHILKKDQKVMAFIRFEERPDLGPGAVYAGSLNVRTDVRGSALGEVLMHEAVLGEAKDHVIHAYVDAKAEVGVAYVEKLGAVLEGVDVETRGETTMHWLKLRLDFVMNKKLKTKNGRIREWIQRGVEHESLDVAKEGDRLVALMTRLKEEGKVITRVLLDKAEPSRRTFILEALPAPKETQTAV